MVRAWPVTALAIFASNSCLKCLTIARTGIAAASPSAQMVRPCMLSATELSSSRSLGLPAPGTYKEFTRLASIQEVEGTPNATEMIRILVSGQEAVAKTARAAFTAADAANDQPTCDLLTQRMQVHEKNAWMLRSLLEDSGSAS